MNSMSSSTSARCLFCSLRPSLRTTARAGRRNFHGSTVHQTRRKPAYPSIKASDMGLTETDAARKTGFKPYTPREKQLLALKYTPEQIKAIEAAEETIDVADIVRNGKFRNDPWAMPYIEDLSKIQPLIDKPIRAPDADVDPNIRIRSDDEIQSRFASQMEEYAQKAGEFDASQMSGQGDTELMQKLEGLAIHPGDGLKPQQRAERLRKAAELTEGPDSQAYFERFVSNAANFLHSPKGTINSQANVLAPEIPKYKDTRLTLENEDEDPQIERLTKETGMDKDAIRKIRVKNLVNHRVVNQTKMGKIQSQYYLTIAGNENGMLGIGEGKSTEPDEARLQAQAAAIRSMKPIPRYEDRTIFGEIEGKVSASVVKLYSRPPGFGNRCQHLIFEMARAAGISDLSARCDRSRNKMNVIKATYQALLGQRLPEDVARARGRKLVDVRKVYYEGNVL